MKSLELNKALMNYIMNPKDSMYNFIVGRCYEDLGQTASAAGYYLRAAEYGDDDLLIYESLLRMSLCFEKQGSRVFTIKGILLRAVSLLPFRPEAYFLLSRIYEINKDWQEAYTWSVIGENFVNDSDVKLRTNVEYPGKYGFTFEKAVAAWWIGLYDESLYLFRQLNKNPNMLDIHNKSVRNNINNLSNNWKEPILYDNSFYRNLRYKFNNSINIQRNYSQCYQDIFVLTMLNGKTNGLFLEIGCGDAFYGNNTALLEKDFGWSGISIDINKNITDKFLTLRKSKVICSDATKVDYKVILENDVYDYLQIDCEPALTSYNTLLKIPFETHKFAVITFEHDFYNEEDSGVREKSRKYLESYGYKCVVNNIAPDKFNSYEDWWVHPELISINIINLMECISDNPKKADDYMLGKI